jgi:hypothetical protein
MEILYTIAAYYVLLCVLWMFFLAVMSLDRAYADDKLTWVCKPFAYSVLIIGLVIDIAANVLVTLLFLDLPAELTVSERLTRYKDHYSDWRHTVAVWFAKHFLDPFDRRGKHI